MKDNNIVSFAIRQLMKVGLRYSKLVFKKVEGLIQLSNQANDVLWGVWGGTEILSDLIKYIKDDKSDFELLYLIIIFIMLKKKCLVLTITFLWYPELSLLTNKRLCLLC